MNTNQNTWAPTDAELDRMFAYFEAEEEARKKEQAGIARENQSLYEKFLRQYANSLDRTLNRRRAD